MSNLTDDIKIYRINYYQKNKDRLLSYQKNYYNMKKNNVFEKRKNKINNNFKNQMIITKGEYIITFD